MSRHPAEKPPPLEPQLSPSALVATPDLDAHEPHAEPVQAATRSHAGRLGRLVGPLRRVPRNAWICVLVACLNGACWSLITVPFQVPDEPDHFAYVQWLAETGHMPTSQGSEGFAPAEKILQVDLNSRIVNQNPGARSISSRAAQSKLEHDLNSPYSRMGDGAGGVATGEPPLYYALETIPYKLASGGTTLDQLELMRLFTVLMGGLTVLLVFLFLREVFPGTPGSWTVGALGVALFPLFGFMNAAINPDAMLYTVSSATFLCLARTFREGLTIRRSLTLGVIVAVGLLTKLNYVGLLPGLLFALIALTIKAQRRYGARAFLLAGLTVVVAFAPILVNALVNALSGKSSLKVVSIATTGAHHRPLLSELSYIWQYFLPPLPGMSHYIHGMLITRQIWFDGLVGKYGWLDTTFPPWVYDVAVIPAAAIVAAGIRAVLIRRSGLRAHAWELLSYTLLGIGLMSLAAFDNSLHSMTTLGEYMEPRYALPLVALFGATLALAMQGVGRRWAPMMGMAIIVLFIGHDVFSQMITIGRYYG
jgi:hypothetical protein